MSTIGTVGSVGSGLDVEAIVKALVDADIAPRPIAWTDRKLSFHQRFLRLRLLSLYCQPSILRLQI